MVDVLPVLATLLGWCLALGIAVPLMVFSCEVIAGLAPARQGNAALSASRVAVLIPAHDESAGIVATLMALQAVAPPGTRILVVADNCSDDTATLARAAGAEVIERHDAAARGKGYALAFGRDHLALDPPERCAEVVIVLDADCRLAPGSIEALSAAACASDAPAQAINLIAPDFSASPLVQISSFAVLVKNLYRSRGMQRLGGAALLTGTGMAFPWRHFAAAELATGALVEDLALGIALTRAGHAPRLVAAAQVRSAPAQLGDALVQRTRWEHGFLGTLRQFALPVLAAGLRRSSLAETLLGLHLLVPPLALLLLVAGLSLPVLGGIVLLGGGAMPLLLIGAMLVITLLSVFAAWLAGGRALLSGSTLLRAPLYVLWKIPVYLKFLRKPETRWQRTPRD